MNLDEIADLFTLLSIGLTTPFLILCLFVVVVYGHRCVESYRKKEPLDHLTMLGLGIAIGFLFNFLDNLYWGLSWGLNYLNLPLGQRLNELGSIPNVPFRQLGGIAAIIIHLYAANVWQKQRQLGIICVVTFFLTVIAFVGLKELSIETMTGQQVVASMVSVSIYMLSVITGISLIPKVPVVAKVTILVFVCILLAKCSDRIMGDAPSLIDLVRDGAVLSGLAIVWHSLKSRVQP